MTSMASINGIFLINTYFSQNIYQQLLSESKQKIKQNFFSTVHKIPNRMMATKYGKMDSFHTFLSKLLDQMVYEKHHRIKSEIRTVSLISCSTPQTSFFH